MLQVGFQAASHETEPNEWGLSSHTYQAFGYLFICHGFMIFAVFHVLNVSKQLLKCLVSNNCIPPCAEEYTVDDNGVGQQQQQLNGTASKTILKWSE